MQWNLNRGIWSTQEMKNHINVIELSTIKLSIQTFLKSLKHKAIHLQLDNMVALTYLLKNGPSSPMSDHSYCKVSSQQTEYDSRLGIKKQFELFGVEASSAVVSENLLIEGNPRDTSTCFQTILSDQDLLFVEAGSIEPSSRRLPTKLIPQKSLRFSPILYDP